jgi:hypothetical protein
MVFLEVLLMAKVVKEFSNFCRERSTNIMCLGIIHRPLFI